MDSSTPEPTQPRPEQPKKPKKPRPLKPLNSFGRLLLLVAIVLGIGGVGFLLFWPKPTSLFAGRNLKSELIIIQINDTYRIDAVRNGNLGGLGRVATLVKQTQRQNPNVILVHAGDFISPSLETNFFQGQQMIDALNYLERLAPVFVVPGNHEFDEAGSDGGILANAIMKSNFPWIASNLTLNTSDSVANGKLLPRKIETIGNLHLGIFGLTIQGAQSGGKDREYSTITASDQYGITANTLANLRQEFHPALVAALAPLKDQRYTRTSFIEALQQKINSANPTFWADINQPKNKSFWLAFADGAVDQSETQKKALLDSLRNNKEFWDSIADLASQRYIERAEAAITELERLGANAIIGLTHLDMADDKQIAALRVRHPSFLWIAGGHEHYAQYSGLSDQTALITKADSNARSAWKISISLNDGAPQVSGEKIDLNETNMAVDQDYQRLITENYHAKLKEKLPFLDDPIVTTKLIIGSLSGSSNTSIPEDQCLHASEEIVRNEKSDWGSYLAAQMRKAYSAPKAQVAMLNGGGIRIDDDLCNQIRYEEFERSIGFPTTVVYALMKGEKIEEILEQSVSRKRGDGSFLQVSGLRFEFSRQRIPGKRILNLSVRDGATWSKLDSNRLYWVALSDYLFSGGDNYDFKNSAVCYVPPGPDLRTLVLNSLMISRGNSGPAANSTEGPFEKPIYAHNWVPSIGNPRTMDGKASCPVRR